MTKVFDSVLSYISEPIASSLYMVDDAVKAETTEIRLRSSLPVALTWRNQTIFVDRAGHTAPAVSAYPLIAEPNDMANTFSLVCSHSVHSYTEEISAGYITVGGGHRVGMIGDTVCHADGTAAIRELTSLNFRLAHEIIGAAEPLRNVLLSTSGMLIVGAPASGKTTVLRDAVRILSEGSKNGACRVCIIDPRRELSGYHDGKPSFDLGPTADILLGSDPAALVQTAIRVMNPEYLVTDEIMSEQETKALLYATRCGVKLISTHHAGNIEQALRKQTVKDLLRSDAWEDFIFLPGIGESPEIRHRGEKGLIP